MFDLEHGEELEEKRKRRNRKSKEEGFTWGSMGRCMAEASAEEPPLEKGSEERGGRGGCLGGGAV